jgi:hypothetical protein
MISTTYILLLLWTSGGSTRPPTNLTAEFETRERCEAAYAYWAAIKNNNARLVGGGCFKK